MPNDIKAKSEDYSIMLTNGLYKAEHHEGLFDDYEIVMKVKETEKSFCFTLESFDSRYCAQHIEMLFAKSNHVIVRKKGGGHAIRIWSNKDFTLYPYQAGIPYYFQLMQKTPKGKERKKGDIYGG